MFIKICVKHTQNVYVERNCIRTSIWKKLYRQITMIKNSKIQAYLRQEYTDALFVHCHKSFFTRRYIYFIYGSVNKLFYRFKVL